MKIPTFHARSPRIVRIYDGKDTLKTVRQTGIGRSTMRTHVGQLGTILAEHTYEIVRSGTAHPQPILCVFILRGGAMLYPAFSARFTQADVCFLGMRRTDDGVACEYATPIPRHDYHAVVLVDCVIGTGATITAVRKCLKPIQRESNYVATLCSSRQATTQLADDGLTVIGMALDEKLEDGLVLPHLGHLDAGDLFSEA